LVKPRGNSPVILVTCPGRQRLIFVEKDRTAWIKPTADKAKRLLTDCFSGGTGMQLLKHKTISAVLACLLFVLPAEVWACSSCRVSLTSSIVCSTRPVVCIEHFAYRNCSVEYGFWPTAGLCVESAVVRPGYVSFGKPAGWHKHGLWPRRHHRHIWAKKFNRQVYKKHFYKHERSKVVVVIK